MLHWGGFKISMSCELYTLKGGLHARNEISFSLYRRFVCYDLTADPLISWAVCQEHFGFICISLISNPLVTSVSGRSFQRSKTRSMPIVCLDFYCRCGRIRKPLIYSSRNLFEERRGAFGHPHCINPLCRQTFAVMQQSEVSTHFQVPIHPWGGMGRKLNSDSYL